MVTINRCPLAVKLRSNTWGSVQALTSAGAVQFLTFISSSVWSCLREIYAILPLRTTLQKEQSFLYHAAHLVAQLPLAGNPWECEIQAVPHPTPPPSLLPVRARDILLIISSISALCQNYVKQFADESFLAERHEHLYACPGLHHARHSPVKIK